MTSVVRDCVCGVNYFEELVAAQMPESSLARVHGLAWASVDRLDEWLTKNSRNGCVCVCV